jgi:transposase
MLKVEEYEKIRKAVLRDGMSQREAARTFGHGRDTDQVAAEGDEKGHEKTLHRRFIQDGSSDLRP